MVKGFLSLSGFSFVVAIIAFTHDYCLIGMFIYLSHSLPNALVLLKCVVTRRRRPLVSCVGSIYALTCSP